MQSDQRPALPHACATGVALAQMLEQARIDAAIDAGLMEFAPCAECEATAGIAIASAQEQLHRAWAARARYLARNARQAERARQHDAKRQQSASGAQAPLPAAAAAALDRARAKAAGRS